jgi:phosphoenolpyruvate-protein phosphotransferase
MAIGKAIVFENQDKYKTPIKTNADANEEINNFTNALPVAVEKIKILRRKLAVNLPKDELEIFESYSAMINDPEVIEKTTSFIENNKCNADFAYYEISKKFIETLEQIDDLYLKQRAEDLKMISKIIIEILQGKKHNSQDLNSPSIVVSEKINTAQLAELNQEFLLGLITSKGGITDHTSIIAKALGIPYLLEVKEAHEKIKTNDLLVIDGKNNCVHHNLNKKDVSRFHDQINLDQKIMKKFINDAHEKAFTKSGKTLNILANVGSLEDADQALKFGADGIGLLRTELCFLKRSSFPNEKVHIDTYTKILNKLPKKTHTLRLLDFGSDKKVSYLPDLKEENPALGNRALRLGFSYYKKLLKPQIRAFLKLSKFYKIKILCPMIANNQDLDQILTAIKLEQKELNDLDEKIKILPPIGIMVETPNVAINPQDFISKVDFFSFGTNDLAQFLMAADRTNEDVSSYLTSADPSLIRLIRNFAKHVKKHKKEISICGELASNKKYLAQFLEMNLDGISMPPTLIPEIKAKIRILD